MSNRPCSHFRNVLVHFGGPWARNALQTGIVASKVHGALWYNAHGAVYGYFEVGLSKFVHRYTERNGNFSFFSHSAAPRHNFLFERIVGEKSDFSVVSIEFGVGRARKWTRKHQITLRSLPQRPPMSLPNVAVAALI